MKYPLAHPCDVVMHTVDKRFPFICNFKNKTTAGFGLFPQLIRDPTKYGNFFCRKREITLSPAAGNNLPHTTAKHGSKMLKNFTCPNLFPVENIAWNLLPIFMYAIVDDK